MRTTQPWEKASHWKCPDTIKTLPKAQRARGLSSCHNFFSYTNLDQISLSKSRLSINFNISISTKLKLKILTGPSFRILTKIQLRDLNQASAAKYWPNFSFKISPELQLQDVDQTLCAKSEEKFSFLTIPQQFENIYDSSATSCTFPQVSFGKEK